MDIVRSLQTTLAEEEAQKLAQEAAYAATEAKMQKARQVQVIKKLSIHIGDVWDRVKQDNKQARLATVRLLRRVRGEYEPQKLTDIRAFRGSEVYIRSAESKCRAASSWITDIYRGDNDLPWSLEPTAVPDLPGETKDSIKAEIIKRGVELQQQMRIQEQEQGIPYDHVKFARILNDWQQVAEKKAIETINKDAKERCDRAATQIRDNNQEGGWANAFKDFIWWFVRAKVGIIKGPTLCKKKEQVWEASPDGDFALVTKEKIASDVYCVSPFNFYPVRGMCTVNDGDIIEVHELTRQAITDLIGTPGYDEDEVRAVLAELKSGDLKNKWLTIDDETSIKQVTIDKASAANQAAMSGTSVKEDKIQALEFYGSVIGSMLIEWGLQEAGINKDQEYQVNCWKIGKHVIKAVINPDSMGRKPYHVSSWAKSPTSLIGEGLIEFAEAVEDILNSIARALQNNIAIASGPQVEVNKDRCDDKTPIYPWKKWESTTSQMKDGPAVAFWQPQMHTGELIQAYEFFGRLLDEMTVPAYAQGASQSGVTAGTATVFTQLLAAASRSIKAVVSNIDDDVITPYIQMCYDFLMKYTEDPAMKGDAKVVAKGVSGLLAKEQQAQRKVEYLQVVANPTFSQALGAKNIGYILAQVAKSNDLSLPDMDRLEGSPTLEELLTKMNMQSAGIDPNQMTGQIGAGGTPTAPQATTMDGAPAGAPEMQQPAQIGG